MPFQARPGDRGMAAAFVRRYRGEEPVTSYIRRWNRFGSTMGVLLFQEQVLRVAVDIAGLRLGTGK